MRFPLFSWIVCLLAGLLGVPARANPACDAQEKVLVGYVAGMPDAINYPLYTHLCHAFLVAEMDGTVTANDHVPNHYLAREAHQAGVKVLLSLGGWGRDESFTARSLDAEAEDHYVKAVMALVDEYDYDGIDLDWEYPDTNIEIIGLERLSRRFRKLLDKLGERKERDMVLTMAASANPITLKWLSNEFLLETMDWVNIMTYDYYGSWAEVAGHHAPMFAPKKMTAGGALSTELTMKYLLEERELPADRIALGIPLYGCVFAVSEPYASNQGAPKPSRTSVNYKQLGPLNKDQGWSRHWDAETKSPWLFAPDETEIICYDDAESVRIKTAWAVEHKLRGIFFWQVDGDRMTDGSNPLQEASRQVLFLQQQ